MFNKLLFFALKQTIVLCLNKLSLERSKDFPEGLPGLSKKDNDILVVANRITQNTFDMAADLVDNGIDVTIENPQTSLHLT
jgi:hypothetical protein